jgi:hypothetical protein
MQKQSMVEIGQILKIISFLITFGIPNTLATFYEFLILHKCNLFQIICLVRFLKDYMTSQGQ